MEASLLIRYFFIYKIWFLFPMDSLKQPIQNEELSQIKEKIKELENKLSLESSVYLQSSLKKQISELRDAYSSKYQFELSTIVQANKENIKELIILPIQEDSAFNSSTCNSNCVNYKNLSNCKIESCNFKDITIENCESIKTDKIHCQGTLNIKNVHNSHIICHTAHLRITNSSELTLEVFCKTGVYLQDSCKITIIPTPLHGNNCSKVFDFNCPRENKNFSFGNISS